MTKSYCKLGISAVTLRQLDPLEGLQVAAGVGFKGYELWVSQLQGLSEHKIKEIEDTARSLGIELLPLMGVHNFFVKAEDSASRRRIFDLAAKLKIPTVTLVPGELPESMSSMDLHAGISQVMLAQHEATASGVSLLLEMVAFPKRPFNSLDQARALCERTGLKLVLDTFHLAVSQTHPKAIELLPASLVGLVHLSDAVTVGKPTFGKLQDEDRVLPGEGGLPLHDILRALRKIGYDGYVCVEVFHPKYAQMDPQEVAEKAYKSAKEFLEEAGWQVQ
jgi:sugar phosphate isomerase/epimerase